MTPKKIPETQIRNEIMLRASQLGHRLFNNPVGLFFTRNGAMINCGLAVGSSDLIGMTSTGIFLAVEVKTKRGVEKSHQESWRKFVTSMGGMAMVARSADEFEEKICQLISNR